MAMMVRCSSYQTIVRIHSNMYLRSIEEVSCSEKKISGDGMS
jgi:hypothetical protein